MAKAQSKIADRYAKALFRLIPEDKRQAVLDSLMGLNQLFDNKKINQVLTSPVVQPDLKSKVLATALGQISAEPKLIQFSTNIANAGRTEQLPGVTIAFERLLNKHAGIVKGVVTTASELDVEAKQSLEVALEKKMGKKAILSFEIKPEILGGLVIDLENSKIDLSLKTKVDSLSKYAVT